MLLEGYLAKKKTYPKSEVHIVVTATAKSILAPSWNLLNDWKDKKINWEGYTKRYIAEVMTNPEAIEKMRQIKNLAKTNDVRLICYEKQYPCHRFILIQLINSLAEI